MSNLYNFPDQIGFAPESEGVYLLYDSSRIVVYVGRADNLRERLLQHPDPKNLCLQRVNITYFAFEETDNSEDREQDLINQYKPKCND